MAKKNKWPYPGRINATQLAGEWDVRAQVCDGGAVRYVPARPAGYASFFHRIKMTWAVFTGRADALFWDGQ